MQLLWQRINVEFCQNAICPPKIPKLEKCNCFGERARLGRGGPRPRGPLGTRKPVHCLGRSFAPAFGARAHRTAAEAAALPIHFNCFVTAKVKRLPTCRVAVGRLICLSWRQSRGGGRFKVAATRGSKG